ncbi:MAG: TolC family protein [Gammaproteobacteria bacterium]|nr:TolC family protein [Gammaproteobacteria bacterium]
MIHESLEASITDKKNIVSHHSIPLHRIDIRLLLLCLIALPLPGFTQDSVTGEAAKEVGSKTYETVLARVIAVYPNLQSAILQIQHSTLELNRIYATLGWNAVASTSYSHDLAIFGTPANILIARGALTRKLESGDSITLDASYNRTDNDVVFIPSLPNPSNNSAVNLSYRRPLLKGAGNIEYQSLQEAAKARIDSSKADEYKLRDVLARQIATLYFGLATIEVNLANTRDGIGRLRRLHEYVVRNRKLGISEEKDILQSQARLDRKLSALSALITAKNQQLYNLNRLMNIPASTQFTSRLNYSKQDVPSHQVLHNEVFNYSPSLSNAYASKKVAESNIKIQRDNKKDSIDVIVSVGARVKTGPAENTYIDQSDLAGKVGLEYRAALDKQGLRATLQQALLSRDIADNQIRQLKIDLNNEIDRLRGLIEDQKKSIASNIRLKRAEKKKFDEAISRFRTGLTTTADLINFEEDLSRAESALANSRVDLVSTLNELARLRGTVWKDL